MAREPGLKIYSPGRSGKVIAQAIGNVNGITLPWVVFTDDQQKQVFFKQDFLSVTPGTIQSCAEQYGKATCNRCQKA